MRCEAARQERGSVARCVIDTKTHPHANLVPRPVLLCYKLSAENDSTAVIKAYRPNYKRGANSLGLVSSWQGPSAHALAITRDHLYMISAITKKLGNRILLLFYKPFVLN